MADNKTNQRTKTGFRGPGGGRGGPGGPMMQGVEKAKNFKGTFRRLLQYLSPYKFKILIVIIFAMISTVFSIVGPKVMAQATDVLVEGVRGILTGNPDAMDFGRVAEILLQTLALYGVSALFSYIMGYIIAGVSAKVAYDLRNSIEQKINRLPLDYFHTNSQGDVLSRITNDVDAVSSNLNTIITTAFSSVTMLVGVLIMMFDISVSTTFAALITMPVSAIGVIFIVKRSQKYFKEQQSNLGAVNGHIEEMYGAHLVVKAFNGEEKSVSQFEKHNAALYDTAWKSQFYSSLIMPLMNFIGNLGYLIVCVLGAVATARGNISIGDIQAMIQYTRNLNQPVTQLANISNQIQSTVAAAERVFEFMDESEEVENEPQFAVKRNGSGVDIEGDVKFDHVRFSYNEGEVIIKDFSAIVRAGQKVAIVGPTGAGKTTLVKLLMRFYDLDSGAIYIDGHNIADFDRHDLRTEFGMVLQDTWLYNDTIRENIRYGRLDATDEEVYAAARAAQADRFIQTLPDGYDMILNEESTNISQGQKQLLTIARAILSDTKLMILDEATSSVDTRTEILIQRAMDNLMHGRTSFIIAHRLSTIRNADLILCLNEGDIVEQGTHDELMAMDGFYRALYQSQFERPEAS